MTRAAHRPVSPAPRVSRTPTALRMDLYALAGRWERWASITELDGDYPRPIREAHAERLRRCADQLLAILDGER